MSPLDPKDRALLQQALNALEGLMQVGAKVGIRPTDITLTIMQNLRDRLNDLPLPR